MDIQYSSQKIFPLYEEDIEYYAHQLQMLVYFYRKHIYIKNEKQLKAIEELEYYATQLVNKNYAAVITNANEIISRESPDSHVKDLPPWVPF